MGSIFNKKYQDLSLSEIKQCILEEKSNKKLEKYLEEEFKIALSQEEFIEKASETFAKLVNNKVKHAPVKKANVKHKRILNLVLSDIHYGANLVPEENMCRFSAVEEARRTAAIVRQVADYKPQYRAETKLYIHLLGDIIQNQLHDPRDGNPLAEQCTKAIYYLTQAIEFLSKHFPAGIKVFCTSGNHGRFKSRHPDRAVNEKWDSLETVIYFSLKTAFRGNKNIEFVIPKTPFYTVKLFNKNAYFSHGDTGMKAPFPNGNINVQKLSNQIDKINASKIHGTEFDLFCFGHVHTAAIIDLHNGTLMTNGALIPPDSYANSIGIHKTKNSQQLFESVHDHIVGDNRKLEVDHKTDEDSSLDSIIQPYVGL